MLDARRKFQLFALCVLGCVPACLTVSKKLPPREATPENGTTTASQPSPKFAELTKIKPGERIALNPDENNKGDGPTASRPTGSMPIPPGPPSNNDTVLPAQITTPAPLPNVPQVTIDPPLVNALRAFLDNDPSRAVEILKSLDKANQEFVLGVMPALVRGAQMNMAQADPGDVAIIAEQMHAAAEVLEPRAALRVDKLTFCRRVAGFGRYDPWPVGQAFQPNDLAELYLELRHLMCQPITGNASGDTYVTRLVSSLEIRDASGRLVDQTDPADWHRRVPVARFERTDYSRSPVRDYFLKYRFPMPTTPGTYTVVVEVRDPAGSRTARSQPLEFRVGP
jgi:hypothetical protein